VVVFFLSEECVQMNLSDLCTFPKDMLFKTTSVETCPFPANHLLPTFQNAFRTSEGQTSHFVVHFLFSSHENERYEPPTRESEEKKMEEIESQLACHVLFTFFNGEVASSTHKVLQCHTITGTVVTLYTYPKDLLIL
jgi:hypothetical protein